MLIKKGQRKKEQGQQKQNQLASVRIFVIQNFVRSNFRRGAAGHFQNSIRYFWILNILEIFEGIDFDGVMAQ